MRAVKVVKQRTTKTENISFFRERSTENLKFFRLSCYFHAAVSYWPLTPSQNIDFLNFFTRIGTCNKRFSTPQQWRCVFPAFPLAFPSTFHRLTDFTAAHE